VKGCQAVKCCKRLKLKNWPLTAVGWRLTVKYSLRTRGKCSWAGFIVTPYLLGRWCYLYPVHLVKWYAVNCIWKHVFSIWRHVFRYFRSFFTATIWYDLKSFESYNLFESTTISVSNSVLKSQYQNRYNTGFFDLKTGIFRYWGFFHEIYPYPYKKWVIWCQNCSKMYIYLLDLYTICPADTATNLNLSWPALRRPRLPAVALSAGHIVYTFIPSSSARNSDVYLYIAISI
jgi:hypothetical protein